MQPCRRAEVLQLQGSKAPTGRSAHRCSLHTKDVQVVQTFNLACWLATRGRREGMNRLIGKAVVPKCGQQQPAQGPTSSVLGRTTAYFRARKIQQTVEVTRRCFPGVVNPIEKFKI